MGRSACRSSCASALHSTCVRASPPTSEGATLEQRPVVMPEGPRCVGVGAAARSCAAVLRASPGRTTRARTRWNRAARPGASAGVERARWMTQPTRAGPINARSRTVKAWPAGVAGIAACKSSKLVNSPSIDSTHASHAGASRGAPASSRAGSGSGKGSGRRRRPQGFAAMSAWIARPRLQMNCLWPELMASRMVSRRACEHSAKPSALPSAAAAWVAAASAGPQARISANAASALSAWVRLLGSTSELEARDCISATAWRRDCRSRR
mmetsp:Transcript_29233/g.93634  ORF Transcript_29233/g.93634 Transcript_29233/m.93634 type:complete len:268 (-) Transcript_29233:739-1542(-)